MSDSRSEGPMGNHRERSDRTLRCIIVRKVRVFAISVPLTIEGIARRAAIRVQVNLDVVLIDVVAIKRLFEVDGWVSV